MNKTFFLRTEDRDPRWRIIDAKGQRVGRLATQLAKMLIGKDKPSYTSHNDAGDYIVVINADKAVFSGKKMKDKEYVRYTGFLGGQKITTVPQLLKKDPTYMLYHAVRGMLPKNKLADRQLKKLKLIVGDKHPHAAQIAGFAPEAV